MGESQRLSERSQTKKGNSIFYEVQEEAKLSNGIKKSEKWLSLGEGGEQIDGDKKELSKMMAVLL